MLQGSKPTSALLICDFFHGYTKWIKQVLAVVEHIQLSAH